MRIHNLPVLAGAALALFGCKSDSGLTAVDPDAGGDMIVIEGKVCDPDRGTWLEGASVYMHLFDDQGSHYNTIMDESDENGAYQLLDVPAHRVGPIYVQYGSEVIDQFEITVPENADVVTVPDPACGGGDAAMAVVTGDYDEFDLLLQDLGFGDFDLVNGQTGDELVQFLSSDASLGGYDVVFFGGGHLEEDIFYDTDGSDVAGDVTAVKTALAAYVQDGGTIVATDWSYDVVESIWPGKVTFLGDDTVPDDAQAGETGRVDAGVVDSEMSSAIGEERVNILFDLIEWPVITAVNDDVTVVVQGDITYRDGQDTLSQSRTPLLVKFRVGAGTVWLSAFRFQANTETTGKKVVRQVLNGL